MGPSLSLLDGPLGSGDRTPKKERRPGEEVPSRLMRRCHTNSRLPAVPEPGIATRIYRFAMLVRPAAGSVGSGGTPHTCCGTQPDSSGWAARTVPVAWRGISLLSDSLRAWFCAVACRPGGTRLQMCNSLQQYRSYYQFRAYFTYSAIQLSTTLYQYWLFCGFSTQWPSSGKISNFDGTPWVCSAEKNSRLCV